MQPARDRERTLGYAYGLLAYSTWGVSPIFWKYLLHVPPLEILAHRIIWGFASFASLLLLRGRMREALAIFRDRSVLAVVAVSSLLLTANWLVYIYAVVTGRVVEASIGYFLNPLVNALLGIVFLKERLRPMQWLAMGMSALGVFQFAAHAGGLPWISLFLAFSFGLYGLVRKVARVDALPGSTIETLILVPVALVYLASLARGGQGQLGYGDVTTHALLVTGGLVTCMPLLWFTHAARRLPLVVLGFLQYLSPSVQLMLAVVLFGEPLPVVRLYGFLCIWIGLAVFSFDAWRTWRASAGRA